MDVFPLLVLVLLRERERERGQQKKGKCREEKRKGGKRKWERIYKGELCVLLNLTFSEGSLQPSQFYRQYCQLFP